MAAMARDPMEMSPNEFELYVCEELRRSGQGLLKLDVSGKRELPGNDGDYEIDASATFEALGVEFPRGRRVQTSYATGYPRPRSAARCEGQVTWCAQGHHVFDERVPERRD